MASEDFLIKTFATLDGGRMGVMKEKELNFKLMEQFSNRESLRT